VNLYLNDWPGGNFTIVNGATGNADQGLCTFLGNTVIGFQYNLVPRICTHAPGPLTVGTLPTGSLGDMYSVNDAVTCVNGQTLTGLGGTVCLVWFNGSVWHAIAP